MRQNGDVIVKTNALPVDRPARKRYRNGHNPKKTYDDKRRVLEMCVKQIIDLVDENPERDGLRDTPKRVARWWLDFAHFDPGAYDTVFDSVEEGQQVTVSGIRVWSLCEHHLLPFYCDLSVSYRCSRHIIGLSKVARIANKCAHRLQVQERLVVDVAEELKRAINTPDVAVIGSGVHLCMVMRGVQKAALMTSTHYGGVFATDTSQLTTLLESHRQCYANQGMAR